MVGQDEMVVCLRDKAWRVRSDQVAEVDEVGHDSAGRSVLGVVVVPSGRERVVSRGGVSASVPVLAGEVKAPTILPAPASAILMQVCMCKNISTRA